MLNSYFLSSILTFSLTYSWYNDFQHVQHSKLLGPVLPPDFSSKITPNIPVYMWDMYKNGVNSSEVGLVKGIFPKYLAYVHGSRTDRSYRRNEIEFQIPKSEDKETLIKAEVRLMTDKIKQSHAHFKIYLKTNKLTLLDEKIVQDDDTDWISLQVLPSLKNLNSGRVVFLIVTVFRGYGPSPFEEKFLNPVLLLSYHTENEENVVSRSKRSLNSEEFEERTNLIWNNRKQRKQKSGWRGPNNCRRESLYIDFSDIEFDKWIIEPSGYEAYQCVGECNFPLNHNVSPTKHAIIRTVLNSIFPGKAVKVCCVPIRLKPISILYTDDAGNICIQLRYSDMVVAECGCR